MVRSLILLTLAVGGCAPRPQPATIQPANGGARQPYHSARYQVAEYVGPGREDPPPQDIREVKIGWFGPTDPNHPTAGLMWLAATLAVEEANQAGGYRGLPFRLLPAWSENPWDTGVAAVTRLAYEEGVWAIAGAPDGPSAHLVAQVVAKARLTLISSVSSDPTTNRANVPWVFSCAPSYRMQAPALAEALVSCSEGGAVAVVSGTDHDSRTLSAELLAALAGPHVFPAAHLEFHAAGVDFDEHLRILREANPAAIALLAGPQDSARFLRALRQSGMDVPAVGGPAMAGRAFIDAAGDSAKGAVFPCLWDPVAGGEAAGTFARSFEARFGREPDCTAAYTYDALRLLIAAIRQSGLNRALIRDAVRNWSPGMGVTGTIEWNALGQNEHAVGLGTIQEGRLIPLGRSPAHP